MVDELDIHPSDASHVIAHQVTKKTGTEISASKSREEIQESKGKNKIVEADQKGSKRSHESSYVLLTFAISFFFNGLLQNLLLPYLMCLLYGCSLNAAARNNGGSLLRLNAEKCFEERNQLEKEGRRCKHTLRLILKSALDIGIVKRTVDLSIDPTFLIYWGKKMIKRWGNRLQHDV